jgi:uncharacterized glyoxalase superfamily protein PhnB
MSTIPFTVDGSDIPLDAPRSMMTDAQAQTVSDAAEEFRQTVMHCHLDIAGRDVTVNAANAPDGDVGFTFGDGTADVTEKSAAGQASATHTYDADGVYTVGVYADADRWFTEAAVNWPPPPPEAP